MYTRTRRYYRAQRRKEEIRRYMGTMMWIVVVLCILIVAVTVALQTSKASKVIAAEKVTSEMIETAAADTYVSLDDKNVIDIARAISFGQFSIADQAWEQVRSEAERVIVIDPGHGGMDGGCVFGDITEKEINRKIANRVVQKLRSMGYNAQLARKGDQYIDKEERVDMANRQNARIYVSIHQNFCGTDSVEGIETWYDESDETAESKRLAMLIQQETVSATGAVERELVSDPEMCVTSKSTMPACLIETGFLSNKKEREKLCSMQYRDQIAEGIAKGIDLYLIAFRE
ncbi:MAG: N-acetylmuramoyl-L-alanine amidase [Eubacterium sp.]|nr:N-acetylmuramoyl-L-alanine amidase [Eubacterium sp.]